MREALLCALLGTLALELLCWRVAAATPKALPALERLHVPGWRVVLRRPTELPLRNCVLTWRTTNNKVPCVLPHAGEPRSAGGSLLGTCAVLVSAPHHAWPYCYMPRRGACEPVFILLAPSPSVIIGRSLFWREESKYANTVVYLLCIIVPVCSGNWGLGNVLLHSAALLVELRSSNPCKSKQRQSRYGTTYSKAVEILLPHVNTARI